MPFVTEELYQRLPHHEQLKFESICIANFPQEQTLPFETSHIDQDMNQLLTTVKAIRSQLAALNVASNAKPTIAVQSKDQNLYEVFKNEA